MRFNEFEKSAKQRVAERHNISEEQLDEILPVIGAVAGGLGRVGAGLAVRGAGALAKGALKGAGALARGATRGAASLGRAAAGAGKSIAGRAASGATRAAQGAGRSISRGAQNAARQAMIDPGPATKADPNATVGTQSTQGTQGTQGTQAGPQIKPGKTLKLPAGRTGTPKPFKITRVKGDEVELQNPLPKPGEPKKFTYNKSDLEGNAQ